MTGTGAVPGASLSDDSEKGLATLRARLALAGHELHVVNIRDGRRYFEVRRWGQARMFTSLHGVEAFAAQVGAL